MEVFYDRYVDDAHAQFQQWRQQHEQGYFVNYKSPQNMMLHHAQCPHLGGTDWGAREGFGSLTNYKKVCSTNKQELERFARTEGNAALAYCNDCAP